MLVSNKELKRRIEELDSTNIFSVTFVKRTTGEKRVMVCRKGVTKALKGGERAYDAKDYNLIFVYDMQKESYRSINLEQLISAKIDGKIYIVRRRIKHEFH